MGGKTASPLRAGLPPFCPIGLGVICSPVAAEFLPGLRPLVTGAVGIRLRLTALGLRVFAVLSEVRGLSREAGSKEQKNQLRLPLQKAVRRSPTRSPPQIGCPKEFGRFCGCAASSPGASDWIKESKTLVLACFWILFARAKSIPGFGGGAPVNQLRRPGPGRPGSQAPKRLASEETPRRCRRQKTNTPLPHKETKARKTSAVPLFLPRRPGPLKPVM